MSEKREQIESIMTAILDDLDTLVIITNERDQLQDRNVILSQRNKALEATILQLEKTISRLRFNGSTASEEIEEILSDTLVPVIVSKRLRKLNGRPAKHQRRMGTNSHEVKRPHRKRGSIR